VIMNGYLGQEVRIAWRKDSRPEYTSRDSGRRDEWASTCGVLIATDVTGILVRSARALTFIPWSACAAIEWEKQPTDGALSVVE
jgi:hypothetical protein